MRDHLGVGLAGELRAVLLQLVAQLAEILDDAVVHDRELVGGVRMRVVLGRLAVGRPAGVADADGALQRLALQPRFEIAELALGAAARQRAAFKRRDAGGIVAAVFQALERIDELPRHRLTAENPNNPAQVVYPLAAFGALVMHRRRFPENHNAGPMWQNRGHSYAALKHSLICGLWLLLTSRLTRRHSQRFLAAQKQPCRRRKLPLALELHRREGLGTD